MFSKYILTSAVPAFHAQIPANHPHHEQIRWRGMNKLFRIIGYMFYFLIVSPQRNVWKKKLPLPTDNIHNSYCLSEPAGAVTTIETTQQIILWSDNILFMFLSLYHIQYHKVIIHVHLLQITKLKIASNPFAKGFREATRGRDSGLINTGQVILDQQNGQIKNGLFGKLIFLFSGKFEPPLPFLLSTDAIDVFV